MRFLYYLFGEGLAWFDVAAVSRLAFSLNHGRNSGKIQQQQQKNSNRKGERTREDRKRPTDTQAHISFLYYFLLYLITERKSHGFPIPCYAFGYYNCDFIRFFFEFIFKPVVEKFFRAILDKSEKRKSFCVIQTNGMDGGGLCGMDHEIWEVGV